MGDSLLDSSVPVIGGFFTDGPKRFKVGYTAGTFSIDIDVLAAPGSFDVVASSQVILIDRGFGNFDLELNYGPIFGSGIAQAGFADGAGGGYLLPGSGIAGAFDGDDLAFGGPICTPTSLTCGLFNASEFFDEDSDTRMPALGRYRFNFVNGVPQSLPMADVPAPGGLLLLLGGLVMLRGTRSLG